MKGKSAKKITITPEQRVAIRNLAILILILAVIGLCCSRFRQAALENSRGQDKTVHSLSSLVTPETVAETKPKASEPIAEQPPVTPQKEATVKPAVQAIESK